MENFCVKHDENISNTKDYYKLGITFYNEGRFDNAIECFREVLKSEPTNYDAYNYIGNSLQEKRRFKEAIEYYDRAIKLNPDNPTSYINKGIALSSLERFDEAYLYFNKALSINPNLEPVYNYMALSLSIQGKLEEAIENYSRALLINPESKMALCNLAKIFADQGKGIEADKLYRYTLEKYPDDYITYQAYLMSLNYTNIYSSEFIFKEHIKFSERFFKHLNTSKNIYPNTPINDRPLTIGYISPDFKRHSVSYFIEPVLREHDKDNYRIICYSNVCIEDDVTERLKRYPDKWVDIFNIPDSDLFKKIQQDKVDILVDLAGHTAYNRISLLAQKPAPIQITWLGYPNTTGLSSIDYKIVDNITDPPSLNDNFYSEKLLRMPYSFLCYLPFESSPEIDQPPVIKNGYITFGSFNNIAKISTEIFQCWIEILKNIDNSHIILKGKVFSDKSTCDYYLNLFERNNIDNKRVKLLSRIHSMKEHLKAYNMIDIALDTFPYNGTTTTCEALWMGVPVITLEGERHASRVGKSILTNIGLEDFIAQNYIEYVEIGKKLSNNINKLTDLRFTMRERLKKSVIMDYKKFTRDLENLYRTVWNIWCEKITVF